MGGLKNENEILNQWKTVKSLSSETVSKWAGSCQRSGIDFSPTIDGVASNRKSVLNYSLSSVLILKCFSSNLIDGFISLLTGSCGL